MRRKRMITAGAVSVLILASLTGCGSSADIGRDAALETALSDAGIREEDTIRLSVSEDRDDGNKVYDVQFHAGEKEYEYEILASDGRILSSEVGSLSDADAAAGLGSALLQGIDAQNPDSTQDGDDSAAGQDSGDSSVSDQGTVSDSQTGQNNSQTQGEGSNASAGGSQSGVSGSGQSGNQSGKTGNSNVSISMDEAIQIALARVSGATERNLEIELDRDDGRYVYEGEIHYNNREYEFEIDANSGTILEWSEERD